MNSSNRGKYSRSTALEEDYVHQVYEKISRDLSYAEDPLRKTVQKFMDDLETGSLVADIGCGNGKHLCAENGIFSIGADSCFLQATLVRESFQEAILGDNLRLPLRSEAFDAVLSVGVIHHFSTKERRVKALREIARILRIGGKVLIAVRSKTIHQSQDVLMPWYDVLHDKKVRDEKWLDQDSGQYEMYSESDSEDDDDSISLPSSDDYDSPPNNFAKFISSESNFSTKQSWFGDRQSRSLDYDVQASSKRVPNSQQLVPIDACYAFVRRALKRFSSVISSDISSTHIMNEDQRVDSAVPPSPAYGQDQKLDFLASSHMALSESVQKLINDNYIELLNIDDSTEISFGAHGRDSSEDSLFHMQFDAQSPPSQISSPVKNKNRLMRSFSDFVKNIPSLWSTKEAQSCSDFRNPSFESDGIASSRRSRASQLVRSKTTATCTSAFDPYQKLESIEEFQMSCSDADKVINIFLESSRSSVETVKYRDLSYEFGKSTTALSQSDIANGNLLPKDEDDGRSTNPSSIIVSYDKHNSLQFNEMGQENEFHRNKNKLDCSQGEILDNINALHQNLSLSNNISQFDASLIPEIELRGSDSPDSRNEEHCENIMILLLENKPPKDANKCSWSADVAKSSCLEDTYTVHSGDLGNCVCYSQDQSVCDKVNTSLSSTNHKMISKQKEQNITSDNFLKCASFELQRRCAYQHQESNFTADASVIKSEAHGEEFLRHNYLLSSFTENSFQDEISSDTRINEMFETKHKTMGQQREDSRGSMKANSAPTVHETNVEVTKSSKAKKYGFCNKTHSFSTTQKKLKKMKQNTKQLAYSKTLGPFYDEDDDYYNDNEDFTLSSYYSMPELYKISEFQQQYDVYRCDILDKNNSDIFIQHSNYLMNIIKKYQCDELNNTSSTSVLESGSITIGNTLNAKNFKDLKTFKTSDQEEDMMHYGDSLTPNEFAEEKTIIPIFASVDTQYGASNSGKCPFIYSGLLVSDSMKMPQSTSRKVSKKCFNSPMNTDSGEDPCFDYDTKEHSIRSINRNMYFDHAELQNFDTDSNCTTAELLEINHCDKDGKGFSIINDISAGPKVLLEDQLIKSHVIDNDSYICNSQETIFEIENNFTKQAICGSAFCSSPEKQKVPCTELVSSEDNTFLNHDMSSREEEHKKRKVEETSLKDECCADNDIYTNNNQIKKSLYEEIGDRSRISNMSSKGERKNSFTGTKERFPLFSMRLSSLENTYNHIDTEQDPYSTFSESPIKAQAEGVECSISKHKNCPPRASEGNVTGLDETQDNNCRNVTDIQRTLFFTDSSYNNLVASESLTGTKSHSKDISIDGTDCISLSIIKTAQDEMPTNENGAKSKHFFMDSETLSHKPKAKQCEIEDFSFSEIGKSKLYEDRTKLAPYNRLLQHPSDQLDLKNEVPFDNKLDSSERNVNYSYGRVNENGASVILHRYHHLFAKNELDELIDSCVDDLHIIDSFHHQSHWCIIAEKVRVWTI